MENPQSFEADRMLYESTVKESLREIVLKLATESELWYDRGSTFSISSNNNSNTPSNSPNRRPSLLDGDRADPITSDLPCLQVFLTTHMLQVYIYIQSYIYFFTFAMPFV